MHAFTHILWNLRLCVQVDVCMGVCAQLRQRKDLLNHPQRPDTAKEVEMYREWRCTCFDWLRGQPRACSTAAAWGIAALWFFCFGWWKDSLQAPTIAETLDTHTSADVHTRMPVKTLHAADRCNNTHACCVFGHVADVPADLARRWETTIIASKG